MTDSTYRPPMWGLWLKDPSGKYGVHKVFAEYGETADAAYDSAIRRYAVPGVTRDPSRLPYIINPAVGERPVPSRETAEDYVGVLNARREWRERALAAEAALAKVREWRDWYATGEAPSPSEWRELDRILSTGDERG